MMRAGGERGQVKEEGCAGAEMYEFTQAEREWKHKGSQQHRAGAQSKHRAGGETATSVTSLHSTQPTTLFSRAQPNIQDVYASLIIILFFKLQYSHRKIHISVIKVYRFLNVSTLYVPLNMK